MWYKKESNFESGLKKAVGVVAAIVLCGGASYCGARKGVEHAVEAACESAGKLIPQLETLLTNVSKNAEAAPAAEAEVETYKEALKHLMAENAALKNAAKTSETEEVPEAPKVEAPEAEVK